MANAPSRKRHPYHQWSPDARALDLVGDKWTLLIVRDLAAGPRRFVELQRTLPGISTEQLRSRLNRMVADGMLTRKRFREVPPRVDYELTPRAQDLMPVLSELANWGYRWDWSPPRSEERVDLGAIFRLAPGRVRGQSDASVELAVSDGHRDGGPLTYTLELHADARSEVSEQATGNASTRLSGTTEGWVAAFAPGNDLHGLEISGDGELARSVIAQLGQPAEPYLAAVRRSVA